jgi:pyrroloquinoline-quinone synthase
LGAERPLADGDFIARLRSLESRYWDSHPFHLRLHRGGLGRDELRLWVANRWYYQRRLPQKDAAIIAACPVPWVRRSWLRRIAYHDGAAEGRGGAQRWLRLAEAVGLSREEVLDERHLLPGVRFAVDAYVSFACSRPWVEGVAAGLTEMFAPGLMQRRVAAMSEHYPWIEPGGLEYFTSRIEVTKEEGASTLDLVVGHCRTREQQDAAFAALAFKCDVLRAILDALDYATLADSPVTGR